MKKLFSSVLSFVFLFNSFIPAFAANCNYEGMLKSSSNPSWLSPECLIGFTCKYMNNDENRAKNRKIGHNGYNAYLAKMDKILHSTGNNAEQDKFLNAANVFVAAYGINNDKKVLLKSGEWVLRPVSKEDIERAINIVNQACSKNGEDKFIDALNQEKQRADSGQRKAFIPDLKYINAEIMYPSEGTGGEPCKDMKEFEALLKSKIKRCTLKANIAENPAIAILIYIKLSRICWLKAIVKNAMISSILPIKICVICFLYMPL